MCIRDRSKHLHKVEEEIGGISLFIRSRRPVRLTTAGEEFVQYARQIVADYDALMRSMEKYQALNTKVLKIGIIPAIGMCIRDSRGLIRRTGLSFE